MQFLTSTVFIAILGAATALPDLTPRQNLKNGVLICPNAELTFANPALNMADVCTRTYQCQSGSDGVKNSNIWTNSCIGCPANQNINKFGNCVLTYI
ncbi:hypothetical protein F53441_9629 [Fusarium austroafricanum]|uniref:Uncharacterized protein n=1 Tax=Fusarium austroafricanum TaxID=2364996 RepID=A0A8H4P375_9HYPO|nr:hypothetical protein F53441_9629 [Fusarium austroafricanum]